MTTAPAEAARTAVVEPPPGYAVLGWALVFVTALPLVLLLVLDQALRSAGILVIAAVSLGLVVWLSQVAFLRARIELAAGSASGPRCTPVSCPWTHWPRWRSRTTSGRAAPTSTGQ